MAIFSGSIGRTRSGIILNCNGCGIYETCEKKNNPGIVHCFSKPYSICYKCANKDTCESVSEGIIGCGQFVNKSNLLEDLGYKELVDTYRKIPK